MTVTDATASWIATLDGYLRSGPNLSPEAADNPRPAWPTAPEWSALRGAFDQLRTAVAGLAPAGPGHASVPHDSLVPGADPAPSYVRFTGPVDLHGRIFMLDGDGPPFTADLRRFVVYVPASYHRTGDQGHHAFVYFPPFWGTAAGRDRFACADRTYPDGFWFHNFARDYLLGYHMLGAHARSLLNTILVLPIHRFTRTGSTRPLARAAGLAGVLTPLFAELETLMPALRGRSGGGRVDAFAVAAHSAGAHHASDVFTSGGQRASDLARLRGVAFLDGTPSDGRETIRALVGTPGQPGFIDVGLTGATRHAMLFQQPNPGAADLVAPARELFPEPFRRLVRGRTQYLPGRNRGIANELGFHWVDTAAMGAALRVTAPDPAHPYLFWHGHINRYLMEPAMSFLRHSFPG